MEDARGIGGSSAKAHVGDDEEEDRCSLDDDKATDTGSQQSFKKNKWTLVAA